MDRHYMNSIIIFCCKELNKKYKITEYLQFVPILKKSGLKSKDISQMMQDFINYVEQNNPKLVLHDMFNKRQISKSNCSEKDLFLTFFSKEYPEQMIQFLVDYKSEKIKDKDAVINEIKELISTVDKSNEDNNSQNTNEIDLLVEFIEKCL